MIELEVLNLIDVDYMDLILQGFYKGILFSVATGFIAQGLNYAIKLFTKNI